ncbi:MAG: Coenzyme F420 hydrogenase/dehydrogenase, beta subunit C-terminal domain [Muribaculaceae bacterium]|nr:Coenzyme F420 hydrogenase/dehydrogenase, beta subunit C-terminal domain [Muribaculaceae bacterium]
MVVIAAHNPDGEVRKNSSAGGVFSILARNVIEQGGKVYGVGFNSRWSVVHKRISSVENLSELRGSKYVFSDINTTAALIDADLKSGKKVLFTGTPCQVAAIRKRFGENDNLLLVEVVCHGAPEAKYWERYINELCENRGMTRDDIASINFRDKSTGWKGYSFTVVFKNGSVFTQPASKNLYMRAFLRDYTLRKACFRCPFKYPDGSKADVTLGDFWGIENLAPQIDNNLGTTIVIARTENGKCCINMIDKEGCFTLEQVSQYNPAITHPASQPLKYETFIREADACENIIGLFDKYAGIKRLESLKDFARRILSRIKK